MKKADSKFNVLYEDTLYRFQQGGLLTGDVVKIRGDALNNDKIKTMSEQFKAQIKNAIDTDLNLRVSSIKSIRPNTTQNYGGYGTDAPTDFYVDIVVEYAPGLWREPMTLPIEILERIDTGINMAPIPDSLKRKSDIKKSAEVTFSDSDRSNPKTNTKLENAPEASDGRTQAPKPTEYKGPGDGSPQKLTEKLEDVYGNMLVENITGENIGEGDEVSYVDDDGQAYTAIVLASHPTGYTIEIIGSDPIMTQNARFKPGQELQVSMDEIERINDIQPAVDVNDSENPDPTGMSSVSDGEDW